MKGAIMRSQKGLSLSGFLLWAVIAVFAALVGFKVAPAYFEYLNIQKQFKAMANDTALSGAQRPAIERAFSSRSSMEDIKSITPQDLEITRAGDRVVISAAYSVRVPLFANVSACLDFYPNSGK